MSPQVRKTAPNLEQMELEELLMIQRQAQERIAELKQEKFSELVSEIKERASELEIDLAELGAALSGTSMRIRRMRPKSSVPPKYRNPENPAQTWSGRGRKPAWYKQAEEAGTSEEDLLVAKS